MKVIQIPRVCAGLATAMLLSSSPSWAGFSSERLGITHVPIGGEKATKKRLEYSERFMTPYDEINTPLSAAEVTQLQTHRQFKDLSPAEVQLKIVEIRKAILCAIDLLSKSDPAKAEGLQRVYAAGMISVGIASDDYSNKVNTAIRDDGRKEFNLEPINLYNPPCGDTFGDGLADQFELMNDLANLAFYAGNDTQGPGDGTAFDAELSTQCRQLAAAEAELERIRQMEIVINAIKTTNNIPLDTPQTYRDIGTSLLAIGIFDPGEFSQAMNDWDDKLKLAARNLLLAESP